MKLNKKTLIIIGAAVALLIVVTSVVLVLANNKKTEPTPAEPNGTPTVNQTPDITEEKFSVPLVSGMTEGEAKAALESAGFKVRLNSEFDDDVPKGKVVSQNMKKAVKGAEIVITVSLGPDLVSVPNTAGLTKADAEAKLKAAGFKVKNDIKCSPTVPEGKIISLSAKAGEQLPRGSVIEIFTSAGISNTFGSTPSNAIEFGIVAAQGDWVYYVNTRFGWEIYKMRHDGSEKQKVVDGTAFSISVLGEWIYFTSDNGINRVKLNGTEKSHLSSSQSQWIFATKDYLYYLSGYRSGNIMRMTHDGKNPTVISKDTCRDVNYSDGRFYYTCGNGICSVKTDGTDRKVIILTVTGTFFKVNGSSCIISENDANSYTTFDVKGNNYKHVSIPKHQMICMNYYDNKLYFYEFEFFGYNIPTICRICKSDVDGTNKVVLLEDVNIPQVNNFLCVEAGWVYYENADDNSFLYRVKTDGSVHERVAY